MQNPDRISGSDINIYVDGELVGTAQSMQEASELPDVSNLLSQARQTGMSMSFSSYMDRKTDYLSPHLAQYFKRVTVWC